MYGKRLPVLAYCRSLAVQVNSRSWGGRPSSWKSYTGGAMYFFCVISCKFPTGFPATGGVPVWLDVEANKCLDTSTRRHQNYFMNICWVGLASGSLATEWMYFARHFCCQPTVSNHLKHTKQVQYAKLCNNEQHLNVILKILTTVNYGSVCTWQKLVWATEYSECSSAILLLVDW